MKTKKILYLMIGILLSFSTWAQSPTQQWMTVLNPTTTSLDQIYGFSTPTNGCADNGNYFYNAPNHLVVNAANNQIGFSVTSGCNPLMGALDSSTGAIIYQNINAVTQQGIASGFDSNGNLFSLSTFYGTSSTQISSLRKTTNTGSVSFTNTLISSSGFDAKEFGILKIDSSNRIYTYGLLHSTSAPFITNAVYCYDNSGVLQWSSATTDLDWYYGYPGRMTTDVNNNVIFSGKRQTTQGDQNTYDIVLRKVNSSGVQQWQVYYDYGSVADYIDSIVTDSAGDVYMTSVNKNISSNITGRLVKFNGSTGAIIYQQQISSSNGGGYARINSNGNLLVAIDGVLKCYNASNGTLLWTSTSLTNYQTFTTDANGNIYVTLKDKVQIYNSAGTLINTITPTIASYIVNLRMAQVDSSGSSVYIIGERSNSSTNKVFITKYNLQTYSDTCNAVSGSLVNGLVAYYPFCGNANDQSGHGYNGTVNGATLTTDRFGNNNSAYSFDGVSNYIQLPNNSSITPPNITVSLWFKILTNKVNQRLIRQRGSGFDASYNMQFQYGTSATNKLSSDMYTSSTLFYNPIINNTVNDQQWHQITFSYDGLYFKIYIDSVLAYQNNSNGAGAIYYNNSGNGFTIGRDGDNPDWYLNGLIDDVGIWNRALTTQEVTQLYNQNQCFTNTTVTDTLVINVGQMSYSNPIAYANNITIAPNPASTQINISFNNITDLNGGSIKIINSLGQQVATTPITISGTNTTMALSTWGGSGLYFVQIVNPQGQIVDIKKILLQ